MDVKLGKYRNYKGNEYEVTSRGFLTENKEEVIIYKQLYDGPDFPYGTLWIRKKDEFTGTVQIEGNFVPRFIYIDA